MSINKRIRRHYRIHEKIQMTNYMPADLDNIHEEKLQLCAHQYREIQNMSTILNTRYRP